MRIPLEDGRCSGQSMCGYHCKVDIVVDSPCADTNVRWTLSWTVHVRIPL